MFGLDRFDDAIPKPKAGCIINSGATTVSIPQKLQNKFGDFESILYHKIEKKNAKLIPIT